MENQERNFLSWICCIGLLVKVSPWLHPTHLQITLMEWPQWQPTKSWIHLFSIHQHLPLLFTWMFFCLPAAEREPSCISCTRSRKALCKLKLLFLKAYGSLFYSPMLVNSPKFRCPQVKCVNKQKSHLSRNNVLWADCSLHNLKYAYQLFMQLLRTPWPIVFIMYEDSTVAPTVATL